MEQVEKTGKKCEICGTELVRTVLRTRNFDGDPYGRAPERCPKANEHPKD